MRWDDPIVLAATITVSATITLTAVGLIVSAFVGRPKTVSALQTDVLKAWAEIETMRGRLDRLEASNLALRGRLTAAITYIGDLIRWVEGGAHAPVPQPGHLIADDVVLPPSWLHAPAETPKE